MDQSQHTGWYPNQSDDLHHHAISQSGHQYAQQPAYSTWRYDTDHVYEDITTNLSWGHPPGHAENHDESRNRGLGQGSDSEPDKLQTSSTTSPSSTLVDGDDVLYPWHPGFVKQFPYMGLVPLLLSIACE